MALNVAAGVNLGVLAATGVGSATPAGATEADAPAYGNGYASQRLSLLKHTKPTSASDPMPECEVSLGDAGLMQSATPMTDGTPFVTVDRTAVVLDPARRGNSGAGRLGAGALLQGEPAQKNDARVAAWMTNPVLPKPKMYPPPLVYADVGCELAARATGAVSAAVLSIWLALGCGFSSLAWSDAAVRTGEWPLAVPQSGSLATGPSLDAVVVESTAIAGAPVAADKVPGNAQRLSAAELSEDGPASLARALNSRLSSINVNDNLDDPYQPDILYRGFEASPVLGTPQGLAVYQNGVRINEAFGDTVNWDLFPDIAIDRVDVVSSSPVYGLNALGGAISVNMKNGFSHAGADAELSAGSFGQRAATVQFGAQSGQFGLYLAGKALESDGWRDFSSDSIRQLYLALGARLERTTLDLSYTRAANDLAGEGAAPVQELAVDRSLVFTGPQANSNRLDFLTLNANVEASAVWSVQGVLYYRQYSQYVENGNTTDYTSCAGNELLCQPDGVTPLRNATGGTLRDISDGGTLPIGEDDIEAIHAYGRGAALQVTGRAPMSGHGNQFSAGMTLDDARVDFYSAAQVGAIGPQLLVLPSAFVVDTPEGAGFAATPIALQAANRQLGLYATDTVDLSTAVALTASGRYNVAHIDLYDARGTALSGRSRFSHLNPAFGATWKLSHVLTAYAGVSQNTRTPTPSEIECSDPQRPCLLPSNLAGDPPNLRQVVAHTTEVGARGDTPGTFAALDRVSWSLALFRTTVADDIYGVATSNSTGFFQNIGGTRRQGLEASLTYQADVWSAYANYSYISATFRSSLTMSSPSNPHQDENGDIDIRPGNDLPGMPRQRLKLGAQWEGRSGWLVGASISIVTGQYSFGDESNSNPRIPGYHVVGVHSSYRLGRQAQLVCSIDNLFNEKYATYGTYGDPTGVGAPGVPSHAASNDAGVDNRFRSPAAPLSAYLGLRVTF